MKDEILSFWIDKYSSQVINYINMVVAFEELTPEELEKKRRRLLLEFIDSSDSMLVLFLMANIPQFLDKLYAAIYSPTLQMEGEHSE